MSEAHFSILLEDFLAAMRGRPLHRQDLSAGADPTFHFGVTVVAETAWHALFIRNLLIPEASATDPVTILHLPGFAAEPARHGTRSGTVVALDMSRRLILIGGTAYAGEIKKAVFTLFNFEAPFRGVLPMHCSANAGASEDVALFFGLSGTGKTTLSNDPSRRLIGDDEHGWSDRGVFNLEAGCYAKTALLDPVAEPQIFAATQQTGTVFENVVLKPDGEPDFSDLSLTENTRAAYPLRQSGLGGTPTAVIFLTADAFGILPPIARLTPAQAADHFLLGYTAKIAGTERGLASPVATFSACFGAPFMPLHPHLYAQMLSERLRTTGASTWLVNTGWTGGAWGTGRRIDVMTTRRLVDAAISGELELSPMRSDPNFGFAVPVTVQGVAEALLDPRSSWADPVAYDVAAARLAGLFAQKRRSFATRREAAE
jgi:phosphoenolpyruvate carboxykinase (ATP)